MKRRTFIAGLGGVAAGPWVARAQPASLPVIGLLHSSSPTTTRPQYLSGFRQGLAETGYAEGRNLTVEYRWSDGNNDVLPALATDLVRRRVTVVVTMSTTPCALAAKAATQTIPIVFMVGGDPVAFGLVASLSQPGGNLTGVTSLSGEIAAKRLQMLREAIPAANPIAIFVNPANLANEGTDLLNASRPLGVRLLVIEVARGGDLATAFAKLVEERAGALLVTADPLFFTLRDEIVALAARHGVPAAHYYSEAVLAGGLMSYGTSPTELSRIAGAYTGRILNGEKPGELPVQRATKMEFVVNARVAKALGLNIPVGLLALADEVIE